MPGGCVPEHFPGAAPTVAPPPRPVKGRDQGTVRGSHAGLALTLMRGVGNLCIGAENDNRYHARQMVEVLIAGLRATA